MRGRKTGRRVKGTLNKATILKRAAAETAANAAPLEFMIGVYRNPAVDPKLRLDAAKAASQYLHGKPPASRPEPERNPHIIEGIGASSSWTMSDYSRLVELEALATRVGRLDRHSEEEFARLTQRAPLYARGGKASR